jgi:hypothetical protein
MLAFRSVQQGNHCAREKFLYELKAGPAGGRLRRPSSAGSNMEALAELFAEDVVWHTQPQPALRRA